MNQPVETSSKIVNPERIARLVTRMCEGSMQVIIRTKDNAKMGIRACFGAPDQSNAHVIFGKISEAGIMKLPIGTQIKIEVLGMPSQVVFITVVRGRANGAIICLMPKSLVSTERRHSTRHKVTSTLPSFMSFSVWNPDMNDITCTPFFSAYRNTASWVSIADISAGGVCLLSRFPSFQTAVESVTEDPQSFLHLPMTQPIPLHAAIRWKRKIKIRIEENESERFIMEYRVGIEFQGLSDEQNQKIKSYIRQLSIADAI